MALPRGRLSQVGFQVQDIAVQLQAGVSPFLVLSQQGSQMASAFGPVGAVLGTVIALAGVAAGVLFGLSRRTGEAADEADRLRVALDEQIASLDDSIVRFRDLTAAQRDLIALNLMAEYQAQQAEQDRIIAQLDEMVLEFGQVGAAMAGLTSGSGELTVLINQFLTGQIRATEFAAGLADLADRVTDGSEEFAEFSGQVRALANDLLGAELAAEQTQTRLRALDEIAAGNTQTADEAAKAVKRQATAVRILREEVERLPPLDETIAFGRPGGPGIGEFQAQLERQRRMFGLGGFAPEEQARAPVDNEQLAESVSLTQALADEFARMNDPIALATSLSTNFASTLSTGFADAIVGASSFADAMSGVIQAIQRAIIEAVIFRAITAALGGAFGGFGGAGQVTAGTALFGGPGPRLLQAGGTFAPRRPFIAGERGWELVMPEVGGRVFSASDTRRILSGAGEGGNTYIFHAAPGMDHAAFDGFKRDIMRELGPGRIEQRAVAAVVNARKRDPRLFGFGRP
ncbi:MAG: phage tail length tape measure family protein, partial [Geminicoccaceae bacterium]